MVTKYTLEDGWYSRIKYKGVLCFREWGAVKPTKKQIRQFMKHLRKKI